MSSPNAGRAAIIGIGTSEYSESTDVSGGDLALTAIRAALDDAGIAPADLDGVVRYSIDASISVEGIALALGCTDLTYWAEIPHGGGASCATVRTAANAVAAGDARYVVCFRSFTPEDFSSNARFNTSTLFAKAAGVKEQLRLNGWDQMISTFALQCQRHMFEYGTTADALADIVLTVREHAAKNPQALRGLITRDEYFESPMVSSPLRLDDCFILPNAGAAAAVVAIPDEKGLPHAPAYITAGAMAISSDPVPYWELWPLRASRITETPSRDVAQLLWQRSGLRPHNIQVAELYDCYSYTLLSQLEDYGLCDKGDASAFVADGNIGLAGSLPVNTHGGSLGEAYIHGFNHVVEGVRQIRGSSYSQVGDVEHVLVTGGTPSATSALVLGTEPR